MEYSAVQEFHPAPKNCCWSLVVPDSQPMPKYVLIMAALTVVFICLAVFKERLFK